MLCNNMLPLTRGLKTIGSLNHRSEPPKLWAKINLFILYFDCLSQVFYHSNAKQTQLWSLRCFNFKLTAVNGISDKAILCKEKSLQKFRCVRTKFPWPKLRRRTKNNPDRKEQTKQNKKTQKFCLFLVPLDFVCEHVIEENTV